MVVATCCLKGNPFFNVCLILKVLIPANVLRFLLSCDNLQVPVSPFYSKIYTVNLMVKVANLLDYCGVDKGHTCIFKGLGYIKCIKL